MIRSLFDLTGKTAVVVGGTSGIGRVLALGLADAGADVIATARRANLVDTVAAEIEGRGRRTLRVACDVADEAALVALRDQVIGAFGQVDAVVCAAGITRRAPTLEMDMAEWEKIVDVNRINYAQHAVAPYGVRARPRAPVAMPIAWDELSDRRLKPDRWTIRDAADRLEAEGDAWRSIARRARNLPSLA